MAIKTLSTTVGKIGSRSSSAPSYLTFPVKTAINLHFDSHIVDVIGRIMNDPKDI